MYHEDFWSGDLLTGGKLCKKIWRYYRNDFANSYLNNDREYMQIYLAEGYEPELWPSEYECRNLYWFEITYDHVKALQEAGSVVYEVPFQEWNGDWVDVNDIRYLQITVIEEDGIFKVSNCQVKE